MAPPAAPAKSAKAKGPPVTGLGPIFKWDAAGKVQWTKDLVLTVKQTVAAAPLDPKHQPYLMVYEADKEVWNDKGLSPDKKLDPIVSVQGNFSEEGVFTVSKTVVLKPVEHCCTAELRLLDKDGKPIKLKDKSGADLDKLIIALPGADTDDDTWELDLALRSSKDKERRQDRLILTIPGMDAVLKNPARYKDDRFDDQGKIKNTFMVASKSRQSYEYFYVHCMSNVSKPLAEWFAYEAQLEIFKAAPPLGAHFIITRDGTIHHAVPNYKVCPHAGNVSSSVKGNSFSLGVELTGLIDDLGVNLQLCRALVKLAANPPAMSGTLGAAAKKHLEAVAAFLCHKQSSGGNKTSGTATTDRCKKMIGALAKNCSDDAVKPLTEIYVPDDRDNWDNDGLAPWGDTRGICNRAIQLLYALSLIGSADGLELKAAKKDAVKVKDGTATCTAAGCDLDSTGEGITLYRMKKDESFPGREAGGSRFATVPKAKIVEFCRAQLDAAIDENHTRGAFRPFADMPDAEFASFIGYTDAQYKALADLTQALHRVYQFKTVVTHHYAAKERKRDPGVQFDWDRYLGDAALAELRGVAAFTWDPADDKRKPRAFAERTHTGKWPA